VVTGATVRDVCLLVDADGATFGESGLAGDLAFAIRADLSWRALLAAFAAVEEIGFEVDTGVAAFGEAGLAGETAEASRADLS
jgi:hypothetical protein